MDKPTRFCVAQMTVWPCRADSRHALMLVMLPVAWRQAWHNDNKKVV